MILINKTIEYLDNYFKKNYRLDSVGEINTTNIRILGPYCYLKFQRNRYVNKVKHIYILYMIKCNYNILTNKYNILTNKYRKYRMNIK